MSSLVQQEQQVEPLPGEFTASMRDIAFTVGIVFAPFSLHGIEIWLYALVLMGWSIAFLVSMVGRFRLR